MSGSAFAAELAIRVAAFLALLALGHFGVCILVLVLGAVLLNFLVGALVITAVDDDASSLQEWLDAAPLPSLGYAAVLLWPAVLVLVAYSRLNDLGLPKQP